MLSPEFEPWTAVRVDHRPVRLNNSILLRKIHRQLLKYTPPIPVCSSFQNKSRYVVQEVPDSRHMLTAGRVPHPRRAGKTRGSSSTNTSSSWTPPALLPGKSPFYPLTIFEV